MTFSFLGREAGRVHLCGHRGYSLHYPENTVPALEAAKAAGATTVEVDVVLTADGEPIILHDLSVDRTTNGHGYAADLTLDQVRRLDAGIRFDPAFAGTRIPTVTEALDWAKAENMGIMLEIKEAERPDLAIDRVAALLEASNTLDRVIVISFDHVALKRAVERHGNLQTEAITHARHADIVGVLKSCHAKSVSIELDMFRVEDAEALHEAGFSNRLSMPRPDVLARYWRAGRDPLPKIVQWIADGHVDSISGDDVPFIARLIERAGRAGRGTRHD
jgi:glycerophosphoryl diester phosphodiesterase